MTVKHLRLPLLLCIFLVGISLSTSRAQLTDSIALNSESFVCLTAGDTISLPVRIADSSILSGLSFSLQWDTAFFEFVSFERLAYSRFNFAAQNDNLTDQGLIGFLAFGSNPCATFLPNDTLVMITLRTKTVPTAPSGLLLTNNPTGTEVINCATPFPEEIPFSPSVGSPLNTLTGDQPPIALCKSDTVTFPPSGDLIVTPGLVDSGSFDDCQLDSLIVTPNLFTRADTGTTQIIMLIAVDSMGQRDTCLSSLTIRPPDVFPPVAVCQPDTIYLNADGIAVVIPDQLDGGSTGTGPLSYTVSKDSFNCSERGLQMVELYVTDSVGSDTCTTTVTILDTTAPVVLCASGVTVFIDSMGNDIVVDLQLIDNGSTDNCNLDLSLSRSILNCDDIPEATIMLTATDSSGNTATCETVVAVQDTIVPTLQCSSVVVFLSLDPNGLGILSPGLVDSASYDNCELTFTFSRDSFICGDLDSNYIFDMIGTDPAGNTDTCTATVLIADTAAPTAICQDTVIILDMNGMQTIDVDAIDGGSFDNCDASPIITISDTLFDCSDIGMNTVTLSITDNRGNTANCTATVTVVDSLIPQAVCSDFIAYLDTSGVYTLQSIDIEGGSSDNCLLSLSLDTSYAFDCSHVGDTVVTQLFVSDASGNIDSCEANVIVIDSIAPTANCSNDTITLDASGMVSIRAEDIDNNSTDNCGGIDSLSIDQSDFDCSDIGNNNVILTVTDSSGNVGSCVAIVNVTDTLVPVAICQDVSIYVDVSGNASILASSVNGGSFDNCPLSLSVSQTDFDCDDIGIPQIVVLTISDGFSNSDTCSAVVTVLDTIAPVVNCMDLTIELDSNQQAMIVPADLNAGDSDNCAVDSLFVTPSVFDSMDIGANVVILSAQDASGNVGTCEATVTILPFTPEATAVCKDDTIYLDESGSATVLPSDIDGGSRGRGVLTFEVLPDLFSCDDIGQNTVMLVVNDSTTSDTCDAIVTILDTLAPEVTCQSSFEVYLDENGTALLDEDDLTIDAADNCILTQVFLTQEEFDCDEIGEVPILVVAQDNSSNTGTCEVVVTVIDSIKPVVICKDAEVFVGANGIASVTAAEIDGGSSDNCDTLIFNIDPFEFNCDNIGELTTTILLASDVTGNFNTCIANITVSDTINPVASCQDATVYLDEDGNATLDPAAIDDSSTDNCEVLLSADPVSFDCGDAGPNIVTLIVSDPSGNSSTCLASVEVTDTIAPTAVCTTYTLILDSLGNGSITASDIDGGSSDNCGNISLMSSQTVFDSMDLGANTIVLTVTDDAGNVDSCDATVIVFSFFDIPVAVCKDTTLSLDSTGRLILDPTLIDGGSSGGGATLIAVPDMFGCNDVGLNEVLLIVETASGMRDTCLSEVTIVDDMPPTAVCNDITLDLNATGSGSITPFEFGDGSRDNCGILFRVISPQTFFNCNDIGDNILTLTLTDRAGNSSSCMGTVTVQDVTPPTINCSNISVVLDTNGLATVDVSQLGTAFDACGLDTIFASKTTFDCNDVGVNPVLVVAIDDQGNSSNCTASVTVSDNEGGTLQCRNTVAYIGSNGIATIDVEDVTSEIPRSVCRDIDITLSQSTFLCNMVGNNLVTVTAVEEGTVLGSCVAQVVVVDSTSPQANCQDITITIGSGGLEFIIPEDIDDNSSDNCGISLRTIDRNTFTCADAGKQTSVTLTVTDFSGNTSTCVGVVSTTETGEVDARCRDISVSLDANGMASIVPEEIDNESFTDCGELNLSLDVSTFDCDDIGNNLVILTAISEGNVSDTCLSNVIVVDDRGPSVTCNDVTVALDASGMAEVNRNQLIANAEDNCSQAIDIDLIGDTTFTCSDIGETTVIVRITDEGGATSTCVSTITVEEGQSSQALDLSFSSTNESNPGAEDGTITVTVTGGSGSYLYNWDNGGNGNPLTDLAAGDYCVTVTDLVTSCQGEGCTTVAQDTNVSEFIISGNIRRPDGVDVAKVNVQLFSSPSDSMLTGNDGNYEFIVQEGNNVTIRPIKDILFKNGVNTFDLVLIAQHILNENRFTSPFQFIAADANDDGRISVFDIIELRKIVLELVDDLPDNTSWRFVTADYVFPNPLDPFTPPYPEEIDINNVDSDFPDQDFIAVKIGDIDQTNDPTRSLTQPLVWAINEQTLKSGQRIHVPVIATQQTQIFGSQTTWSFDATILDFVDVQAGSLPQLSEANFNLRNAAEGELLMSWSQGVPHEVQLGDTLFTLVFDARQSAGTLREYISFDPFASLQPQAYLVENNTTTSAPLELQYMDANGQLSQQGTMSIQTPWPNPFAEELHIGLSLPAEQELFIRLYDLNGKERYTEKATFSAGKHVWTIQADNLEAAGMYIYRIESKEEVWTGRLVHNQP